MVNTFTEKSIQVNGTEISYVDEGNGGIAVIFVHGFPFDKTSWYNEVNALKAKHRAISYDIRGFGSSSRGSGDLSMDLFATDLVMLMDALKIEKAVVCGLSMGGYIIMNAIGRFPDRFAGLVLADTQCIADSAEGKEKRYQTIKKIEENGLSAFADTHVANVFCKKSSEEKQELTRSVKQIILNTATDTVTGTLKALAERRESCNALKSVNVPVLILCGKEDSVTPLSQSELLNNTITSSHLETIKDAGHMSNLEQPETFAKHLLDFLAGISRS